MFNQWTLQLSTKCKWFIIICVCWALHFQTWTLTFLFIHLFSIMVWFGNNLDRILSLGNLSPIKQNWHHFTNAPNNFIVWYNMIYVIRLWGEQYFELIQLTVQYTSNLFSKNGKVFRFWKKKVFNYYWKKKTSGEQVFQPRKKSDCVEVSKTNFYCIFFGNFWMWEKILTVAFFIYDKRYIQLEARFFGVVTLTISLIIIINVL